MINRDPGLHFLNQLVRGRYSRRDLVKQTAIAGAGAAGPVIASGCVFVGTVAAVAAAAAGTPPVCSEWT